MDAAAEIGRNRTSKHHIQSECGEVAGCRGTGRPKPSRKTKFSVAKGQGNNHFPSSAGHEQDWQPYPIDIYFAIYVMSMQQGCKKMGTYFEMGTDGRRFVCF